LSVSSTANSTSGPATREASGSSGATGRNGSRAGAGAAGTAGRLPEPEPPTAGGRGSSATFLRTDVMARREMPFSVSNTPMPWSAAASK
jgi:hypothetical protein